MKYLIINSSFFTTLIFILIARVSRNLSYFSRLINMIDCVNNTPHPCIIHLLCLIHLDLALNLELANQVTKIGGHRFSLACYRIL
jgi:hypothetical protein